MLLFIKLNLIFTTWSGTSKTPISTPEINTFAPVKLFCVRGSTLSSTVYTIILFNKVILIKQRLYFRMTPSIEQVLLSLANLTGVLLSYLKSS